MVRLGEPPSFIKTIPHHSEKVKRSSNGCEEIETKKPRLITFSTDSLDFIHNSVDEHRQTRFTKVGKKRNLIFTLIRNENKLIKTLFYGHGFTQGSPDSRNYNVAWTSSFISGHKMRTLKPWQRLNMFPRSKQLTFKDEMYTNIARSASRFGEVYNFIPESFVVPRDRQKFEESVRMENDPVQYIVKPVHSCEGKGIFFITNPEELPDNKKLLVSRYIKNPLLVNGHKFDLRIYAAVTSFYPLVAYLYSEGLTRFASSEYSAEFGESASYIHLTNYSLNKKNENYVRNESLAAEDHGHKWTLGALLRYLEKEGHDTRLLMLRIEDLVVKTFLSVQSSIASVTRSTLLHVGTNFHLFGFDILLDEQLKPWLLEVNLNPSLATEAPLDVLLKPQMIVDLLNLICVPQIDPTTSSDEKPKASRKKGMKRRADGFHVSRFLTDGAIEKRVRAYKDRLILEEERSGGFVRIFPRENSLYLYKSIMEVCGPENYDALVYTALYGPSSRDVSDPVVMAFHEFMNSCDRDASMFSQCLPPVRKLIYGWYKGTTPYIKKITEEGANYRATLPIVRKTARLRTDSYSCYLRKKKEIAISIPSSITLDKEDQECRSFSFDQQASW